jgi:hypothetical protein
MVRDFLMEEVWHDTPVEQLATEWEVSPNRVDLILGKYSPQGESTMLDLVDLLSYTQLDFGITIRDPVTKKEITFFAADNLASDSTYDQQTEEVVNYEMLDKGLEGIPVVNTPVKTVDGDYDISDAEFEEIHTELGEQLCENCLIEEKIPESMLCQTCTDAGVECHSPESDAPDGDPEELMAVVDRNAQVARDYSESLLRRAGLLKEEGAKK